MKKKRFSIISIAILAILLIFMAQNIFARKPAVAPVRGISIDEQEIIPPDKTRAFDFRQPSSESSNKSPGKVESVKGPVEHPSTNSFFEKTKEASPIIIMIAILLLPFLLWAGVSRKQEEEEEEEEPSSELNNTVDLSEYFSKKNGAKPTDGDEEDKNKKIYKAS